MNSRWPSGVRSQYIRVLFVETFNSTNERRIGTLTPILGVTGLESLLQHEVQRTGTMGGGSIRDASNVLFHQRNCFRAFQVRNQNVTLHLQDLLLAEKGRETHQLSLIHLAIGEDHGTHPAVTHEKTSHTTLSNVTLFLMSAKAFSRRGGISSLIGCVNGTPRTFN